MIFRDVINHSYKVPEKRKIIRDSPYAYNSRPRLKTAVELLKATESIETSMEKLESPIFVLHGLEDTVNDIEGSRELIKRSKSADKSIKEYPDAWHALTGGESDEFVAGVVKDMLEWVEARNAVFTN